MNYTEIRDKIILAIAKSREENKNKTDTLSLLWLKLDLTKYGLDSIGRTLTLKILEQIQFTEKILAIPPINYPQNNSSRKTIIGHYDIDKKTGKKVYVPVDNLKPSQPHKPDPKAIYLELKQEFNNWYSVWQYEKNQKLDDLDQLHLENIYNTVLDIDERLQINPSTKVKIKLNQDCRFPALEEKCDGLLHSAEYRQDAIIFLVRKDIVTDAENHYTEYGDNTIEATINLEKFQQFKNEIAKIYQNKTAVKLSSDEILYAVTYNEMTGEILINNKVLKKTNLDSLTDNIFAYLHKNPDRKIKIDELQKATGEKTIKDLPKVIENAGFTGNLLRTFFRVSKTAIFFRPRITKSAFEKLNIEPLNLETSAP